MTTSDAAIGARSRSDAARDSFSVSQGRIHLADNLDVLRALASGSVDLVYVDPPFNTGKVQRRTQLRTARSADGDRVGFQGRRYQSTALGTKRFDDRFDDYLAFLEPRLRETRRVLAPHKPMASPRC